jgi:hypothetical protein
VDRFTAHHQRAIAMALPFFCLGSVRALNTINLIADGWLSETGDSPSIILREFHIAKLEEYLDVLEELFGFQTLMQDKLRHKDPRQIAERYRLLDAPLRTALVSSLQRDPMDTRRTHRQRVRMQGGFITPISPPNFC